MQWYHHNHRHHHNHHHLISFSLAIVKLSAAASLPSVPLCMSVAKKQKLADTAKNAVTLRLRRR